MKQTIETLPRPVQRHKAFNVKMRFSRHSVVRFTTVSPWRIQRRRENRIKGTSSPPPPFLAKNFNQRAYNFPSQESRDRLFYLFAFNWLDSLFFFSYSIRFLSSIDKNYRDLHYRWRGGRRWLQRIQYHWRKS